MIKRTFLKAKVYSTYLNNAYLYKYTFLQFVFSPYLMPNYNRRSTTIIIYCIQKLILDDYGLNRGIVLT